MRWVWNKGLRRNSRLGREKVSWDSEVLKAAIPHDDFAPKDLGLGSLANTVDAVSRLWAGGDLDRDHASGRYRLSPQGRARADRLVARGR